MRPAGHRKDFTLVSKPRLKPDQLRSHRWFGVSDMRSFLHRQRVQQMGFERDEFIGKPVIGIINTWSELSTCHIHLRERAEAVKRGVFQSGGFPAELPALSVSEPLVKPTTMLYRNALALEVEELIRSHPVDGVVLMGGCDKSTPGLIMGALSADVPAIFFPAGAMTNGDFRGQKIGAGTHTRKFWDDKKAGLLSEDDWVELETEMTRSIGTCNTMGTASTMTSIADAMGLSIPGGSSILAVQSAHSRLAHKSGTRIVDMVWEDLKISKIVTAASVKNGIVADMALGGSTNAAIHLIAMAGRNNIEINLKDFDEISKKVPILANLLPSGEHLMEDFAKAGGLKALLTRLTDKLDLDCLTVTGKTLGEEIQPAQVYDDDVIRPLDNPVTSRGTLTALFGNLAPNGAVIKASAASPELLNHTGPAVVFENVSDMYARIHDPELDVSADSVLVLRNGGPQGGPGMPEWGNLPVPEKLLKQGVRDMVRVSDARMSGTHFGTCVLHVSPESFIGGPLALVQDGDMITLNEPEGILNMDVSEEELETRRSNWIAPDQPYKRGYIALYAERVTQADKGCDFDFLEAGPPTPEPEIY
jgi:dihydroxy-acid dehydratase